MKEFEYVFLAANVIGFFSKNQDNLSIIKAVRIVLTNINNMSTNSIFLANKFVFGNNVIQEFLNHAFLPTTHAHLPTSDIPN